MEDSQRFAAALEEQKIPPCKYCGRLVFAGKPCCYDNLYEMWENSQKEILWLRKVQSRQARKIQELLKKQ